MAKRKKATRKCLHCGVVTDNWGWAALPEGGHGPLCESCVDKAWKEVDEMLNRAWRARFRKLRQEMGKGFPL